MSEIPIGVQNFREIREADGCFVDKSPLIDRILSRRLTGVFLFTRPRRFGKSVNLSMLESYLNLKYAGNNWFEGLAISDIRPSDPEKNAYPVVMLDMKDLAAGSAEAFRDSLRVRMAELYETHLDAVTSDIIPESQRRRAESVMYMECGDAALMNSLRDLTSMLERHHGRKVAVLIDEYDSPINRSYGTGSQKEILDAVRSLLSPVFKGNDSLRLAVITGVFQIAKESIFSGLNNLRTDNILDTGSDEMFGFTPEEVQDLCALFGHPEKFVEARDWYDGYRFGDAEIYNPWSVLNYIDRGFVPDRYWAGTSGNSVIDDLISVPDSGVYKDLMVLGSGGSLRANLDPTVTFSDIVDRTGGIYAVMAMAGYLRAVPTDAGYELSIPNREMYSVFSDSILYKIGAGVLADAKEFSDALLSGDTDGVTTSLGRLLRDAVSARVLDGEHPYQTFITGILMGLLGNYRVTADFESGDGYHDIRMERLRGSGPNVIVEIKRASGTDRSPERLEALCEEALAQMEDRGYAHGLEGATLLYGVAFDSKTPTVVCRRMDPTHRGRWP